MSVEDSIAVFIRPRCIAVLKVDVRWEAFMRIEGNLFVPGGRQLADEKRAFDLVEVHVLEQDAFELVHGSR